MSHFHKSGGCQAVDPPCRDDCRGAARGLQRGSRSGRAGRRGSTAHSHRLARDHAGDRPAGRRRDRGLRLLVPGIQPACLLLAGVGVLRPSGADRLVDPRARRRGPRRRRMVRIARTRSLPAPSRKHEARRDPGRGARLEVAFPLPRRRRGERQRARGPGGRSDPLHHHLERRDEQLLRAPTRKPDLCDGGDGDAALAAGRPRRDLRRVLGELQRPGFRRHALRSEGAAGGRLRQMDRRSESLRRQPRSRPIRRTRQAEPEREPQRVSLGRATPVRIDRERIRAAAVGARSDPRLRPQARRRRSAGGPDARQAHLGRDPVQPADSARHLDRGDRRHPLGARL